MPASDITLSAAALGLFSGILGAVVAALVGLFWLLVREKDKSYGELRVQCDARYAEMRAERDRVLLAQQEQERNMLTLLNVIRDGSTAMNTTLQRLVTQLEADRRERR